MVSDVAYPGFIGHETTSGLLSFSFALLLKNSAAYRTAQQEVDDVCGKGPIKVEHLKKLGYLNAVLRETLRLYPPILMFNVRSKPGTESLTIGEYAIGKDEALTCQLTKIHRDPKYYGDDADEFRPERMLDEEFKKLPPHAWKVHSPRYI